jgi:hypothetical protein
MAEQSPNPLGLPPTIWVTLIIAVAGTFALNQRPFQDPRPADSSAHSYRHIQSEDQDVEARLWEDPLAAAVSARDADDRQVTADRQACAEQLQFSRLSTLKPGPTRKGIPVTGSDCATELAASPTAQRYSTDHLGTAVANYVKGGGRVLLMGALVSGAPYADDIETRRRTRYAVLSGLHRSGYIPMDPEHIGYVSLSEFYSNNVRAHDIAAYEWFESGQEIKALTKTRVLLIWLDQDGFRLTPLSQFSKIVDRIAGHHDGPAAVSTVIIGPVDSDGLRAMATDLLQNAEGLRSYAEELRKNTAEPRKNPAPREPPSLAMREIGIYSARATASDQWVFDAATGSTDSTSSMTLAQHFNEWAPRIHLYRGVANDERVASALCEELHLRGVRDVNDIVLIAERDTLYARLMGKYFDACKDPSTSGPRVASRPNEVHHPLIMTYLRGLDGLAPPISDPGGSTSKSRTLNPVDSKSSPDHGSAASEGATGQGQLDYLRRLAATLVAKQGKSDCGAAPANSNTKARADAGPYCIRRDIKAIGVISSDIYDKLLVLQALRGSFPRATFFTFDLDARLIERQNLQWTRQLVIGSSLGLALRPELQDDVPPFRDSYQATTFYSTILAIHRFVAPGANSSSGPEVSAGLDWTNNPHIFEIGRTRPFDLTNDDDVKTSCNYDGKCPSITASRATDNFNRASRSYEIWTGIALITINFSVWWIAMGTVWIMGSVTIPTGRRFGNRQVRRLMLVGLLSIVIALLLVGAWPAILQAVTYHQKRVPASIFGGASLWAASLFEVLSILAVIALVLRGQRKLDENAEQMREEFGFENACADLIRWYGAQASAWTRKARIKEFFWFPFTRLSARSGPVLANAGVSELEALIAHYLHRGTAHARCWRVTLATILSTALLMTLESIPGLLFGGGIPQFDAHSFERSFGNWSSVCSLFAMQFLIFWVTDAMLLSRSFLLALLHDQPQWPLPALNREFTKVALPEGQAVMWLNLSLIARRTGWVANLIWYPSLVIAGMFVAAFTVQFGEFRFADNPIALVTSSVLIIIAVVLLRRAAEKWRADVIDRLEDERLRYLAGCAPNVDPEQGTSPTHWLDRLLDRVTNLRDGAFAPYSEQPLVRAFLVPALTFVATAALQYWHVSPG